jgi:hypothetical protein
MNQLLDLATEAYGGPETFSRLGRGLKHVLDNSSHHVALVAPRAGAWIETARY